MKNLAIALCIIARIHLPALVNAQNFQATYTAGDFGITHGIAANANHIVMQSGLQANRHDILLTDVDMQGNVQWSYSYGDSSIDEARNLIATSDQGFLVTGISVSTGLPDRSGLILKVDSSGAIQWQLIIGDGVKLEAMGAIELSNHGYIVLARESRSGFYLVRIDQAGNVIWMNRYYQAGQMNPENITKLHGSDHFYLTGELWNANGQYPFACRMDESGNVIWSQIILRSGQQAMTVTAANIDVTNRLYFATDDYFFYFVIMDENGILLHYSGNGDADNHCHLHNTVNTILPLPNGLMVLPTSFSCLSPNAYVAFMDTSGNEVWRLSDPIFSGTHSNSPRTKALLTDRGDFLFFDFADHTGQLSILVKSTLTYSNSCNPRSDGAFIHDVGTLPQTTGFLISQVPFAGFYPHALNRSNFAVSSTIGCVSSCRVATVFSRPEVTEEFICKNSMLTFNNYSLNASSYQWKVNGTPVSSSTDLSYLFGSTGHYTVSLVATDGTCSDSSSYNLEVVDASMLAAIWANGPTTFCSGNYVVLEANYENTSFQWMVNGANIPGANSGSYAATSTGNYACAVTNACGAATSNTVLVNVQAGTPPTASITAGGSTTLCTAGSVTLNANTGPGLMYQWRRNAVPIAGATASSYVTASAGNYSCSVSNICGSATSNSIAVTVNSLPSQPGAISGPASVCRRQNNVSYSIAAVSGATSYTWTVPPGTKINSGQGSVAIVVKFGNSAGTITVKANNSCGSGLVRSMTVSMPCRETSPDIENGFEVLVYPNPSSHHFTLKTESGKDENCMIVITDLSGRKIESYENIPVNTPFDFGYQLSNGIYFAELIHGDEKKVLRLVKNQ